MTALLILSLISLLFLITVIIDSYLIARKIRPDYELKEYNRWYVYVIYYLLIITCANKIASDYKSNLLEAFRTPSLSMYPAIEYHDCFLADKKAYKKEDPRRGDIIVFASPEQRNEVWCKRVVAVAGDTFEMQDNQLIINGEKLKREQLYAAAYVDKDINKKDVNMGGKLFVENNGEAKYEIFLLDTFNSMKIPSKWPDSTPDFPETKIPKNHCFVLGDNRNVSVDSRQCGSIPLATVKGRADYLYWPAKGWSRFGPLE